MRKTIWIVPPLLLLLAAIGAPSAHADTYTDYTIDFTQTVGSIAAPTGTIILDDTSDTVSASILWNGQTYVDRNSDLIGGVLVGSLSLPAACAGPTPGTTGQEVVALFEGCLGTMEWFGGSPGSGDFMFSLPGVFSDPASASFPVTDPDAYSSGALTLSVNTPEPGTAILMLIGIGLLFVMRKRIAQRIPPAR